MSGRTADGSPAAASADLRDEGVRHVLAGPHPPLPPDLAARAVVRARRLRQRRLATGTLLALAAVALAAALIALAVAGWPGAVPSGPPAAPPPPP
ncbi:hypothetical protein GCM10027168_35690 [Streptomyces capparidis]